MRFVLILATCLLVFSFVLPAQAGSAVSLLEPYRLNMLEDDDYESGILASAPTLAAGDSLYGMLKVDPWVGTLDDTPAHNLVSQRFVSTNTFTGVFVITVVSATQDVNGEWDYVFGPASAADWATATASQLAPSVSSTMLIAYDDDDAPGFVDPITGPTTADAVMTAADGVKLWEFGFTQQNPSLFWTAHSQTNDISQIIAAFGRLTFSGALDVTQQVNGPTLLHFNYPFSSVMSQIQFEGRNQRTGQGLFTVPTDAEIYLRPTPEPASLALFGLGLAAACGYVVRRRRRS
jgi:hypothetical protein